MDDSNIPETPMRLTKLPDSEDSDFHKNILVVGNGPQTFEISEIGSTLQYKRVNFADSLVECCKWKPENVGFVTEVGAGLQDINLLLVQTLL